MKIPTLTGSDAKLKKDEIKRYFNFCHERYERLFDIVKDPKAYYQKLTLFVIQLYFIMVIQPVFM